MHISELENMESGLLPNNDRYYDTVQIHVPKGYIIPIELLNLTPHEWKDILNKAAKSHVDYIISLENQSNRPRHIQRALSSQPSAIQPLAMPLAMPLSSQPSAIQPLAMPLSSQPLAMPLTIQPSAMPLSSQPLAMPLAGQPLAVNELTVYDEQQIAEYYCLGQSSKIHPLDKKQMDKQLDNIKDEQNQNVVNSYVDVIQSYKSLQCVIC